MIKIEVLIPSQQLIVYHQSKQIKHFTISSAKNGVGEIFSSEKTPRGQHIIHAKIGENSPENTVFVARKPTGEIYSEALRLRFPDRDWILTRILWLRGLEPGVNSGGNTDTFKRYIYIHGTPNTNPLGVPLSHGCIRMHNSALIELFDLVSKGTSVEIIP